MEQQSFDLWQFLAGLGVFLYGMNRLEHGLKELGGNSFKNILQQFTDSTWKAVLVGALITAVLQSSSLVTLMVLAFLGAKVIKLKNALGIILGANLGTSITAWIVATLGFKFSVAGFSMPFLGIGCLLLIFFQSRVVLKNIGMLGLGFGLLFLGLEFMKVAIEAVADQVDLQQYAGYGLWVFLIIGIILTALIQSSSATIVIVLSAMNAEVLDLTQASAVVLGATIGTTITVAIGALGGVSDKKRLATGYFIFNAVTGVFMFWLIEPTLSLTTTLFPFDDPLLDLVLFNTFTRLIGIVIFLPFMSQMERFLSARYKSSEAEGVTLYLKNVDTKIPSIAIDALEKEVNRAFLETVFFYRKNFRVKVSDKKSKVSPWQKILKEEKNPLRRYVLVKELHDEIILFQQNLLEMPLSKIEADKLEHLVRVMQLISYCAKDIKDIVHNLESIRSSEDEDAKIWLKKLGEHINQRLLNVGDHLISKEKEGEISIAFDQAYFHQQMDQIHQLAKKSRKEMIPTSSLSNVLKQSASAMKYLEEAILAWDEDGIQVPEEGELVAVD
ncbi:MAG: Na/Pi symporter [Cyclobacteriaceae bacterium]|nr:Na/Pi cotransporter family protein [Cyclobacteriaceae bacterium]MCH8515695.1 Na/Pi symporter [Cyclobacteriaceae bacterium]